MLRKWTQRSTIQLFLGAVWIWAITPEVPATPSAESVSLGYAVTQGAAPGYIEDRACAVCHYELYESYQEVGMAQSFYRPGTQPYIEDFDRAQFHHAPSDRYYELIRQEDRLIFKRWLLDDGGNRVHEYEREVDWIMGSGNHSRTYLFQTEQGEMFEFPIQWYSQTQEWGMAPGFDRADHQGLGRIIRRECMFCHNAYPDVPEGTDDHWDANRFPQNLPEGIGCQRCHGPGAAHVEAALSRNLDEEDILSSIVNPAKLAPDLRDDVCNQCHLQPTVALFGVRRFERGDYSFRPGEPLSDYLVQMEVDEEGKRREDRFEINHHAHRLYQSPCYMESNRELSCFRCHDPHRKIPEEERAAHYRSVCLECHEPHSEGDLEPTSLSIDHCVACHMPTRRPQDVVHTVMTDHRIGIYEDLDSLTEFIDREEPILTGIDFLSDRYAIPGPLGEIYKAVAVLRAGGNTESIAHLWETIRTHRLRDTTPYRDLAKALIGAASYEEAGRHLSRLLSFDEGIPVDFHWQSLVASSSQGPEGALDWIDQAIHIDAANADYHYNRGLFLFELKRFGEALASFDTAIHLRDTLVLGHHYRGRTLMELGRIEEAALAFETALRVSPTFARSRIELTECWVQLGREDEAIRVLQVGIRISRDPEDSDRMRELRMTIQSKKPVLDE